MSHSMVYDAAQEAGLNYGRERNTITALSCVSARSSASFSEVLERRPVPKAPMTAMGTWSGRRSDNLSSSISVPCIHGTELPQLLYRDPFWALQRPVVDSLGNSVLETPKISLSSPHALVCRSQILSMAMQEPLGRNCRALTAAVPHHQGKRS